MVASKFLKWTEERNIYILTVLHQNPTNDKARGHVGTELINKAQTVLSIRKDEKNENISIVEPQQCRDKEPEIFAFEINEFGIPIAVENFEIKRETGNNKDKVLDLDDFTKVDLLKEVFSFSDSLPYTKLRIKIQEVYSNQLRQTLGDNKAKDLITLCKDKGYIKQKKEKGPYFLGETNSLIDNVNAIAF
jgi:hypothetical protein